MNHDAERIYTFLGFAQKAGKIASGENTVEAKIKERSAKLLIIAEDAPLHTKEKMERLAMQNNIHCLLFGEKSRIGQSIGKSPRNVVLISDKNFAEQILQS